MGVDYARDIDAAVNSLLEGRQDSGKVSCVLYAYISRWRALVDLRGQ